jgi:hypothetical protein
MLIEDGVKNQESEDWRKKLIEYNSHPENGQGRRMQRQALSYTVINGGAVLKDGGRATAKMHERGGSQDSYGGGARGHVRNTSIGAKNVVGTKESRHVLARYAQGLFLVF